MNSLVQTFCEVAKPPARLSIVEWCNQNVRLPYSARNPRFDTSAAKFLEVPMLAMGDDSNKEIVVMAPIGAGKSTMLEGLTQWIISESGGDILIAMQTDPTALDWVETRFEKTMNASANLKKLVDEAHKSKKWKQWLIQFPHLFIKYGGANLTNLQSKSVRWVYMDEVWLFRPGMVREGKGRTHDRHNSRVIMVSQGGFEGDDLDNEFNDSEIFDFGFHCPHCGEFQIYDFLGQMRYEVTEDGGEFDWPAIYASVHYECKHGGCKIEDTAKNRRAMSCGGEYMSRSNKHKPGKKAYTFTAMALHWITWGKLVEEFITANFEKELGDDEKYAQFIQKRLGQSYVREVNNVTLELQGEEYTKGDWYNDEKINEEAHRFMTVDVQQGHFYAVVRAWRLDKSSRLLYEGRIESWEALRMLQETFGIANRSVLVDRGYMKDDVANNAQRARSKADNHSWLMSLGEDRDEGYLVKSGRTRYRRPFSDFVTARTTDGMVYRYINFSNLLCKDMTMALMSGKVAPWETPTDVSKAYFKQVQNEHKVQVKANKWRYEEVKDHVGNHFFDCEVMQTLMASMYGILSNRKKVDSEA